MLHGLIYFNHIFRGWFKWDKWCIGQFCKWASYCTACTGKIIWLHKEPYVIKGIIATCCPLLAGLLYPKYMFPSWMRTQTTAYKWINNKHFMYINIDTWVITITSTVIKMDYSRMSAGEFHFSALKEILQSALWYCMWARLDYQPGKAGNCPRTPGGQEYAYLVHIPK